MASNNRDMNLRIRAKDETGPGVRSAQSALERLAAAQKRTQARRDLYSGAVQSAKDLKQASDDAAAASLRLGERMGAAKRPSRQLREEFQASRDAARQAKTAYMEAATELSRLQGRRGSFAAFDQIASGSTRATAAIRQQATAAADLAREQDRAAAATTRAAAASRQQGGVRPRGDLADKITGAYASRNGRGPLGLRPYELTNLGYQVNDLFTQIASGTPVMQAFAQQGGQIAQIFPAATSGILRFIPVIGIAVVALAPFISAMKRSNDEAQRMKDVEGILRRSGEAASYTAPQLAAAAKNLEDLGAKGDDAKKVLTTFVRDAVDPAYINDFSKASAGLAKIMGTDIPTAAEKVSSAFTGNADAVLALDDELNFLTDAERKHIEAMRESQQDAEARTAAFAAFQNRYGSLAAEMEGPWSRILKNFGAAWVAFVDYVNFIDWSKVRAEVTSLIGLIDELTSKLPGARTRTYAATGSRITELEQQRVAKIGEIDDIQNRRGASARWTETGRRTAIGDRERGLTTIDRELAELRRRQAAQYNQEGMGANRRPRDTTRDAPPPAYTPPRGRGGGQARTGKSDEERQAEAQARVLATLLEDNEARQFQLSLLSETERQQEVLTNLRQAELRLTEVGLTMTDEQRQAITDSTTALYDAQKAQEATKVIEQARLDLAQQREEVETREAFIQRQLNSEMKDATAEQKATYADILNQLYDMEASKRRQAQLDQQAASYGNLLSTIQEQMDFARDNGDRAAYDALRIQLEEVRAKYLEALQAKLALLQSTANTPEAQAEIAALSHLIAVVQRIGQEAVVTNQQLADMFAGGATNAMDDFFGRLEEGQGVFAALRDSFLQFAADFLRQIAQMIAMQAILNALGYGNVAPGAGSSTGVAGWINGLFRHDGGLVGSGGGWRPVNPAVFAGAMRYHGGGIAGLAPDEVPAILQRNEEVLTEDDPRHRNNGGLSGRGSVTVKNVNVIDPGDMVAQGLSTESGEQSFFNFIGRNAGAIKAQLG